MSPWALAVVSVGGAFTFALLVARLVLELEWMLAERRRRRRRGRVQDFDPSVLLTARLRRGRERG